MLPTWLPFHIRSPLARWRRGLETNVGARISAHFLGLPLLAELGVTGRRTSDTAYLLGSGASIAAMSDRRWDQIERGDSFGFNFWLAHDLVPTFYAYELGMRTRAPLFRELGERRADAYKSAPKLLTNVWPGRHDEVRALPESFIAGTYITPTVSMHARTDDELRAEIQRLRRSRMLASGRAIDVLPKYRATLSMLVVLASQMGYERIVLCGVDLDDPRYFFEVAPSHMSSVEFPRAAEGHPSQIQATGVRPIAEVLVALRDLVLEPREQTLQVESPTSALAPLLGVVL